MLVLTRSAAREQSIIINGDIEVKVLRTTQGSVVRLGIIAPKNMTIHRKELLETDEPESSHKTQMVLGSPAFQDSKLKKDDVPDIIRFIREKFRASIAFDDETLLDGLISIYAVKKAQGR